MVNIKFKIIKPPRKGYVIAMIKGHPKQVPKNYFDKANEKFIKKMIKEGIKDGHS